MASYHGTIKSAVAALTPYQPQIIRRTRRVAANALIAEAYTPPRLRIDHVIAAEHMVDDSRFSWIAMGWPLLVRPESATTFLVRRCGGAIDGMSLNVREDGNVNAIFSYPLLGPMGNAGVPEEMVAWMLGAAVRAVGLIGGHVSFMNLCDAGLSEFAARKWVKRWYCRYSEVLDGNDAWDALIDGRRR